MPIQLEASFTQLCLKICLLRSFESTSILSLTNSPSSSLSWFLSSDNSAPELSSTEMKLAGRDAGDVADTLLDVPVPACAVDDT